MKLFSASYNREIPRIDILSRTLLIPGFFFFVIQFLLVGFFPLLPAWLSGSVIILLIFISTLATYSILGWLWSLGYDSDSGASALGKWFKISFYFTVFTVSTLALLFFLRTSYQFALLTFIDPSSKSIEFTILSSLISIVVTAIFASIQFTSMSNEKRKTSYIINAILVLIFPLGIFILKPKTNESI